MNRCSVNLAASGLSICTLSNLSDNSYQLSSPPNNDEARLWPQPASYRTAGPQDELNKSKSLYLQSPVRFLSERVSTCKLCFSDGPPVLVSDRTLLSCR